MRKPKNKRNEITLPTLIDTFFTIHEGKVKNKCEDFYAYSINDRAALLAVCDGCGGLGALTYPEWNGKTGAYMASRAAIFSLKKWFEKSCSNNQIFSKNDVDMIKEGIQNKFTIMEGNARTVSKIKGSMVRPFPTTLAAAVIKYNKKKLNIEALWAGDSRVYCFTKRGLSQLSVDDIYKEDALSNLTRDGALTNVISADGNYTIHSEKYEVSVPCIIISSTDGCFGYIHTPMHFEYILLFCLQNANNVDEWKGNIIKYLQKVSGDDATMCLATFGYNNFSELKRSFADRTNYLNEKYIIPLEDSTDKIVKDLWDEYKKDYYCMLKEEYRRLYL